MAYRPRIALTMRLELETRRFYLGRDYAEAIVGTGGSPVHIPLIPDRGFIDSVLQEIDGILLPGADADPDPGLYGEDPHPRLRKVIPEKDETDILVLEAAEKQNIPVLAICYGMQILNVARGGTLIQDIETQVPNHIKHDQGVPLARNSHSISIGRENHLSGLVERLAHNERVKVNSHHHQAARTMGENLSAIAWANDGIVEGIEDTRPDRFVLGVQWHPELNWATDPLSRGIFDLFIATCASRAAVRRSNVDETQPMLAEV